MVPVPELIVETTNASLVVYLSHPLQDVHASELFLPLHQWSLPVEGYEDAVGQLSRRERSEVVGRLDQCLHIGETFPLVAIIRCNHL